MAMVSENSCPFLIARLQGELRRDSGGSHQLLHLARGSSELLLNRKHVRLAPGSTLLLHPEDLVRFGAITGEDPVYYDVRYNQPSQLPCFEELLDDFDFYSVNGTAPGKPGAKRGRLALLGPDALIAEYFKKLFTEMTQKSVNYQVRGKLMLSELLLLLSRAIAHNTPTSANAAINYIDHMIEKHFADEFKLDRLEEKIGISKSRLCRLYRGATGQTIMDSLRIRRLNEAAEMLTNSDLRISEISKLSGFSDLSYFYRAFADKFGSNPGEFRKKFSSAHN